MKRVIPFLKFRFFALIFSLLIIGGGLALTFLTQGFNWGMDFLGGFSAQVRIAPVAFTLVNQSESRVAVSLSTTEARYTVAGEDPQVLALTEAQTIKDIIGFFQANEVFRIIPGENLNLSASLVFHEKNDQLNPGEGLVFQLPADAAGGPYANINDLRSDLLNVVGSSLSIQQIGEPALQQYIIRLGAADLPKSADGAIDTDAIANTVISNLEKQFGVGTILLQSKESLSPQTAQTFATGSIIAIVIALGCMLLYVTFRFRINFAVAAVIALIHDVATTIAFVGIFKVEVNTAVVAALLTIIGFSINDTIVIYDRIRENEKLLKGHDMMSIMNVSLSQTLARTFITSFTVFVAIFPLYIFGSGPVRDFSFTMLFGIVTGTYSSIFVAAPLVLGWQRLIDKGRRKKEIKLYGKVQSPELLTDTGAPVTSQTTTDVTGAPETVADIKPSTGPIVRVQRILEKKKKKKQR